MTRRMQKAARQKRAAARRKRQFVRLLPVILMCFGAALIVSVAGIKLYTQNRKEQLVRRYEMDVVIQIGTETKPGALTNTTEGPPPDIQIVSTPGAEQTAAPEETDLSGAERNVIGVLEIPKLDLRVAVGEGVSSRTLRYAVGHFSDTALPGETGNCALIGHRSYLWGEFFNRLDEMERGDEVYIKRGENTFRYTVSDKFVVEPEELWVLNQGETGILTLITCTPVRVATHRLVVRCDMDTSDTIETAG
jgi:sortase A